MATKCEMIDSSFPQSFMDITFIKTFLRLLSERYCRAEENQMIAMIVLPWRLSKTIPSLPGTCASEYFGSVRFISEEKRDNIVRGNWPSLALKGFGKGGLDVVLRDLTLLSGRGVIAY